MKNLRIITFILVSIVYCGHVWGQDVWLYKQADVDAFDPSTTMVSGSIYLGRQGIESNINDLSNLSNITSVSGSFKVYSNISLKSLESLNKLNVIGGSLVIDQNDSLTDLSGLENLTTIGSDLIISFNSNIKNIDAIVNLTNLNGSLRIHDNRLLKDILGIRNITNVNQNIYISQNPNLDSLSGLINLTHVGGYLKVLFNEKLLNLYGLSNLETVGYDLDISGNENLTNISDLSELSYVGNSLHIGANDSLKSLNGLSNITSIPNNLEIQTNYSLTDISALENITSIGGSLKISSNKKIKHLHGLANIDSIGKDIYLRSNYSLLDLYGLHNLKYVGNRLWISVNRNLENIDHLSALTKIGGDLEIEGNESLKNIDGLTNLTKAFRKLIISRNYNLSNLDGLSNMSSVNSDLTISLNTKLNNCCGIQKLVNSAGAVGGNIFIYANPSECSSAQHISNAHCFGYYTAKGTILFDTDEDDCDTIEHNINLSLIAVDELGNKLQFFPLNGTYSTSFFTDKSYKITPQFPNPYFYVAPDTVFITLPEDSLHLVNDFCVTPLGEFDDLEITVVPLNAARPGFEVDYKIVYKNKGTTTLSGKVRLEHNYADGISFVEATPSVDSFISDKGYQWNFLDLAPFEQKEILISVRLNSPQAIPPFVGGEELCFTGTIFPLSSDETPDDNIFSLKQIVVNSFDPNDKTCLDGNVLNPELVGNYVSYMIRFENTGTASAVNIKVTDTINPRIYDINTLQITDASHSVEANIQGNVIDFVFSNIELSHIDSINDGYVVFKIKTRDDLLVGDSLSNFADIYFDFNSPIRTNTATTEIKYVSTSNVKHQSYDLKVFPNPAQDKLNIDLSSSDFHQLRITNTQGKICHQRKIDEGLNGIDISDLENGMYFIDIQDTSGNTYIGRFLKME